MAREQIRDFSGKIIATRETSGNKVILRDFYGKILGTFDPVTNQTRDFYGKIIGTGDQLMRLVK